MNINFVIGRNGGWDAKLRTFVLFETERFLVLLLPPPPLLLLLRLCVVCVDPNNILNYVLDPVEATENTSGLRILIPSMVEPVELVLVV